MSLQKEFEIFLDREWPLWRNPRNNGGVLYHQLRKAFMAGFEIGDKGPTAKGLGSTKNSISLLRAVTSKRRNFRG
jgi:hypothetical protein